MIPASLPESDERPRGRRRWLVWLTVALVAVVVVIGAAGVWMKMQFDEPAAADVVSVARHFQAKSVLAVFAHPDDEISVAGLLDDAAHRSGATVRLIIATKGETGTPEPPICHSGDLGLIREAETRKDGFALGVAEQEVWAFPDGGLAGVEEKLADQIAARFRRWQPDLVLTFHPGSGLTLHADHRAIGRATLRAVRLAADSGAADVEGEPFAVPRVLFPLMPRQALSRFGGEVGKKVVAAQPAPALAMRVDASIKTRSWRIQESQQNYLRKAWGFPPWLLYRLFDQEFYAESAPLAAEGAR